MAVAALETKHDDAVKPKFSVFSLAWDRLGVIMSGLCLIDCLVLPVVSTLLISLQSSIGWVKELHWYLLPVIGITGGIAFHHSFKAHRAYSIVASGVVGYLMLAFGELFEPAFGFKSINYVSVTGSALLISAHVRNLLLHNRGHAHHEH
ncbi:MerC domain-containing protein [Turneriella parva]|uniref:MerC mercury resistance protein n=1 Tax=Turneriella parva (strain ATCC BAA-1111 / DSM 21527 / NCTC 11395 / H) TaxID=869212 RepID=I4B8D5_TURPD|nr:MerC domain-containing protein [Turneriella parva]AFM13542.1 hypothetical protein Turpa_2903 [Turneriella parva DSM 21527]